MASLSSIGVSSPAGEPHQRMAQACRPIRQRCVGSVEGIVQTEAEITWLPTLSFSRHSQNGLRHMPRKNWRNCVTDLSLCLPQFCVEDEPVRERLESRSFTHRDATGEPIVVLNVSVALGTDRIRRTVSFFSRRSPCSGLLFARLQT